MNSDPKASQTTQRSGDTLEVISQQSNTPAQATGETHANSNFGESTDNVYEAILGYERVNYDPRLVRALLHRDGAVQDGTSDRFNRTIIL